MTRRRPVLEITEARPLSWWLWEAARFAATCVALTIAAFFAYAIAG